MLLKPGSVVGRLTLVRRAGKDAHNNLMWLCRCSCGSTVVVRASHLRRREKRSCGCYRRERSRTLVKHANDGARIHGLSRHRLYRTWYAMLQRCENTRHASYSDYGGRGISVCEEWHELTVFVRWALDSGYASDLEIDRVDNDGPYSPSNCRWVTNKRQARNKRTTRWVEVDGRRVSAVEAAELLGINYNTLLSRLRAARKRGCLRFVFRTSGE